ncbi:MAG: type VI secretion system baseplate subunit TssF, partial [Burkholderiaceae bacterium]
MHRRLWHDSPHRPTNIRFAIQRCRGRGDGMNSRAGDNELLDYYLRELDWLRNQGRDFAKRYPKVGARLDLHGGESHDPHTE